MISKPVPPVPVAPVASAASAAVLLAGRSPKTARVAGGARSAVLLPELNVSKYIRDVLTFKMDGKTEPDEVPVYFDKESKDNVYIQNLHGLAVLCGVKVGTVQSALHNLLEAKPEFKKVFLNAFKTCVDIRCYSHK